jgi:hypothetical protein
VLVAVFFARSAHGRVTSRVGEDIRVLDGWSICGEVVVLVLRTWFPSPSPALPALISPIPCLSPSPLPLLHPLLSTFHGVDRSRGCAGVGGTQVVPDDDDDERHRDFARRRHIYHGEGRATESGMTGMHG